LLTASGSTPVGSSTVQYTFTRKHYTEQHNLGRVRAVLRRYELYPGIYLTSEHKAQETLSHGSRRVPAGTMKTEYAEQNIHNKNT